MNIRERGIAAARSYLERSGQVLLDREESAEPEAVDILGIEGDTLVGVLVQVQESSMGIPEVPDRTLDAALTEVVSYRDGHARHCTGVRVDVVSLLVIAEDRALLRHHRAVRSG